MVDGGGRRRTLTDRLRELWDGSSKYPQHPLTVDADVGEEDDESNERREREGGCKQLQQTFHSY